MPAADAVELGRVRGTHRADQNVVPLGRILRQVAVEESRDPAMSPRA